MIIEILYDLKSIVVNNKNLKFTQGTYFLTNPFQKYEGVSKSFEPNMERARNLDLFCFIFQRSPLPTPHTCPI